MPVILDHVVVGIFVAQGQEGVLYVVEANKKWWELVGREPLSLPQPLTAVIANEGLIRACQNCWQEKKQIVHHWLHHDREINVTLSPVEDQIVGTCQETTAIQPLLIDFLNKYPDGMIVLDSQGVVQFVNPAAEELFDRPAWEIVGQEFGLPLVQGEHTEIEILRRSGEITPAEMRVIQGSSGESKTYIIADLRDARVSQAASQQLLRREEELFTLLTAVKKGITLGPSVSDFVLFNPAMEAFTGYSQAEANSNPHFVELLYPDREERERLLSHIAQLRYQGETWEDELKIRCADGTIKHVAVSVSLLYYRGKPMYLSSYTDISGRKAAEAQLYYQMERERLLGGITLRIQRELDIDSILHTTVAEVRELLQTERVVIFQFLTDWSGRFVVESVQPPWESVLAKQVYDHCFHEKYVELYTQGRVHSINDVLTAPIHECHRDLLLQFQVRANLVVPIVISGKLWGLLIAHHCSAPRVWQTFEINLLQQIASHVAVALQQSILLQTVRQLNTRLEAEVAERTAQLQQSLEQLEQALSKEKELSELKSHFVSMASHEFRTPLATIQAASDALLRYSEQMTPQQREERLHKIQIEVRRMTELLEDILSISKVESGTRKLQLAPIDIAQLCQDILGEISVLASDKHHIHFQCSHPIGVVWIDTKLMRQVLVNLLSNAIKYSPRGGNITLTLRQEQQNIIIQIKDEGMGIPLKDQERIFDAFYRAQNVGNIAGTGLGLSIAKSAVELQGGKLTLQSQEGVGTIVTVTLPIGREV
ncbi:MAG: ATP-binding protein [Pseudanabaenaceae cyanobacterium]